MEQQPKRRRKQEAGFADATIFAVADGGSCAVRSWVEQTAAARGVILRRNGLIRFAEQATRLSDAEAHLDQTEQTLVALTRAGVLTSFQRGLLQVQYLR